MESSLRTVTIDRGANGLAARELMRQHLASRAGRQTLVIIASLALLSTWAFGSWVSGVSLGVVVLVAQLAGWRLRVGKSLRNGGYDVGESITVGYLESGEFTVRDGHDQVLLPRGSAVIRRRGGIATVLAQTVSFILPTELLSDADVAFLEGHGDVPPGPRAPAVLLPLTLEVTAAVQGQLVAAKTRLIVTSADFLLVPLATAVVVTAAVTLSHSWIFVTGAVAMCLACLVPQWLWLARSRRFMRAAYPLGATIRAAVTPEQLMVSNPHGVAAVSWRVFQVRRYTTHAVLLRRDRGAPATTQVFPRALFPDETLDLISSYVPRRF